MKNSLLWIGLENIRSVYNVGSVMRTAEAVGVDKMILTGYSAHPPHPRLAKTALGAAEKLQWEYHPDLENFISGQPEVVYVSFELTSEAVSMYQFDWPERVCLIFGNEIEGVSPRTLRQSKAIVKIPMLGSKTSLNVASSAAIALYHVAAQQGRIK